MYLSKQFLPGQGQNFFAPDTLFVQVHCQEPVPAIIIRFAIPNLLYVFLINIPQNMIDIAAWSYVPSRRRYIRL